jgi:hypothetical protein
MMDETTLFMFGGAISLLVFGGIFVYVMYSFKEWSGRQANDLPQSSSEMASGSPPSA